MLGRRSSVVGRPHNTGEIEMRLRPGLMVGARKIPRRAGEDDASF